MTKWAYLGAALALGLVTLATGQLAWLGGTAMMLVAAGLRALNDQRRAREAASREQR